MNHTWIINTATIHDILSISSNIICIEDNCNYLIKMDPEFDIFHKHFVRIVICPMLLYIEANRIIIPGSVMVLFRGQLKKTLWYALTPIQLAPFILGHQKWNDKSHSIYVTFSKIYGINLNQYLNEYIGCQP